MTRRRAVITGLGTVNSLYSDVPGFWSAHPLFRYLTGEAPGPVGTGGHERIQQYALLGAYDFLTVVEAPDNATVAHLSVDLGSRGTVGISTFPALEIEDFVEKLKGPKQLGHD